MTQSGPQRTSGSSANPVVSVLTATIPGREALYREAVRSVEAQTLAQIEHIVLLDKDLAGCANSYNRLAAHAKADWLILLADDDLLLPKALELLWRHAEGHDADIWYSPPLVWGEDERQFHGTPPDIPATALIRTSLWRELRGYDESLKEREDNDLWRRALGYSAKFARYTDHPTWIYRFWGGNKSRAA